MRFHGNLCWRWCPNEEGIKTGLTPKHIHGAHVGGGALMKKGLRRVIGTVLLCGGLVGGGALMKKGLRPSRKCRHIPWRLVGGGALMKKGLRRLITAHSFAVSQLEVVP